MEVDPENLDAIADLEARLYGQVHHGSNSEASVPELNSDQNNSTLQDVDNNAKLNTNRYWVKGQNKGRDHKKRINPFAGFSRKRFENPAKDNNAASVDNTSTSEEVKVFRPYVSILSTNAVIPNASGDSPKSKGSDNDTLPHQSVELKKTDKRTSEENKASGSGSGGTKSITPFSRNVNKLAKVLKYQLKKMKAAQARDKRKDQQKRRQQIETILVESSEEEEDDVVVIPVPPPDTVTIYSSGESEAEKDSDDDEEEEEEEKKSNVFLKPRSLTLKPDEKSSSRCVSPSSVMSDDFIGQTDRSRILQQKDIADDQDLIYSQETVDSYVYRKNAGHNIGKNTNVVNSNLIQKPSAEISKRKTNTTSQNKDYNVTQSNFRALDVYESESSDMPDYERGNVKTTEIVLESDVETETERERTKKLKKRSKSGSAKESDAGGDNSTDSEDEEQQTTSRSGLPFIVRGEAVESCKDRNKRKRRRAGIENNDSNDREFINTLKIISQNKKLINQISESDKSDESSEDITAREMAEDVLNRSKSSKEYNDNDNIEEVTQENPDAIPGTSNQNIENILDKIDKLHSVTEEAKNSDDNNSEMEEYTGQEEMLSISDVLELSKKSAKDSETDNGLHVVYTHGNHVGWSEEMNRFYNWTWGDREFDIDKVLSDMNPFSKWTIYTEDKYAKGRMFPKLKCYNCCEFGHIRAKCPKPKKPLICYMCGEIGHLEPRCPNTICLRCGNKTNVFTKSCSMCEHENRLICPICKMRGHSIQLCPDKWRRYHSTTEPNEYPNQKVLYNKKRNCCICTSQSHLPEDCRSALKFLQYPIGLSEIKSHAKSYDDSLIKYPHGHNVTGYSLISHPSERVLFKYSSEIKPNNYYGRFLKAVGLQHLRTWTEKRKPKRKSDQQIEDEPKNKSPKMNLVLNPFAKNIRLDSEKSPTKKVDQEQNESNDVSGNEASETIQEKEKNSAVSAQITETATENIKGNENNETVNTYDNFSATVQSSTPNEKKVKSRQLGALPDFIPLNYSDYDDISDNENFENDNIKSEAAIKSNPNDTTAVSVDENESCEAKIYLTKFHSKFLLSPEGNQYLIENSKKFDVTCRIEWVSVGNILIIHGLPRNQDNFHQQLLEKFRNLSDQSNRRELDKSQNLPKRRNVLIRFLNSSILQLDKNLGNVIDLFKRLEDLQYQQTKTSWKVCEKTRKTLNMILMGQAGLRKGRENLDALLGNLKHLKDNTTTDIVPENKRAEISEHWRYIFSSQPHENYGDLIQQYKELRKKNELPKLNFNLRMAGSEVIDIGLTDEQKQQQLNKIKTESNSLPQNFDDRRKDEYDGKVDNRITSRQPQQQQQQQHYKQHQQQLQQHQQQQQQYFNNKQIFKEPKPWQNNRQGRHSNNTNTGSFVSRSITEVNTGWKNRCNDLINQLDKPPLSRKTVENQALAPSIFWSRECMRFIDNCLAMNPSNYAVCEKLLRVQDKARRGLLSHNNYKSLMKIFNVLKGSNC